MAERLEYRDYMTVTSKHHNIAIKDIMVKHLFFKDPFSVHIFDDRIEFRKASLDYKGKVYNSLKQGYGKTNSGWFRLTFQSYELESGEYCFSDESNDEAIIIYFKDDRDKIIKAKELKIKQGQP